MLVFYAFFPVMVMSSNLAVDNNIHMALLKNEQKGCHPPPPATHPQSSRLDIAKWHDILHKCLYALESDMYIGLFSDVFCETI